MIEAIARWWDKRSRLERLLTGVAFFLALVLAGRNWIAAPLQNWHASVQERIAKQELLLKSHEELLRKKPVIEQRLKRVREERAGLDAWLLSGKTATLSAVELQEIVQTISAKGGARITSISVIPHEIKGGFRRISVKLSVESNLSGLSQLLQGLEAHSKKLLISNMEIRSFNPRAIRLGPSREDLRASLTVFGFMSEKGAPVGKNKAARVPSL
jgi:hypothetical protein